MVRQLKKTAEITLGGKPVTVRQSARLTKCYGYCEAGKIVISSRLSDHEKLTVFLHECLHALFWQLDEDVVDEASRELADALEIVEVV